MDSIRTKLTPPEGYELDRENSTFEEIVWKPIKEKITYEDIVQSLLKSKRGYWVNGKGEILRTNIGNPLIGKDNIAPNKQQLERMLLRNKLENVALYLNDGWKPDWNDITIKGDKFCITLSPSGIVGVSIACVCSMNNVYFKNREIARRAIEIMGEEDISKLFI